MRVLTYNCCALPLFAGDIGARLKRIGCEIAALDPDLILLQEIFLPYQLEILQARLEAWPHVFFGKRSWRRHAGGLAIFSRYPLEAARFTKYREQGSWLRFSALAKFSGKGYMSARLRDSSGAVFELVQTHMIADYRRSAAAEEARRDPYPKYQRGQIEELARFVRDLSPSRPLLLAGDFNMSPHSKLLRAFLKRSGLRDSMAGVLEPSLLGRRYYRLPYRPAPDKRLDYVLHRGGGKWTVNTRESRYVFKGAVQLENSRVELSDHCGVFVELEVGENGG